jgi:hypothetical protein
MQVKFRLLHVLFAMAVLGMTACEESEEVQPEELEVQLAEDIPADVDAARGAPANFTFFDLETGTILQKSDSNSAAWDIALSATTILTNNGVSGPGEGGATIVDGIFEDITEIPMSDMAIDTEESLAIPNGSGNGWYNYTGNDGTPMIAVLPIPGRVLIVRTGEGNYAKIEILSYYQGNPDTSTEEFANLQTRSASRYYTFRYVVQTGESTNF